MPSAQHLRNELENLREAAIAGRDAAPVGQALTFDDLNEVEKSAALTGVSPDDFAPISFINAAHYNALLKSNALDGGLTQKIEAFKVVASGQ